MGWRARFNDAQGEGEDLWGCVFGSDDDGAPEASPDESILHSCCWEAAGEGRRRGVEEIIALFSWRLQIALRDGGVTRHLGDDRGLGRLNSKHSEHYRNKLIQEALLTKFNFQLISKHLRLSLGISFTYQFSPLLTG